MKMRLSERLIHCVVMGIMMSLVISGAVTFFHIGFSDIFLLKWLHAWATALPVAVVAIFFLAPLAMRITMAMSGQRLSERS